MPAEMPTEPRPPLKPLTEKEREELAYWGGSYVHRLLAERDALAARVASLTSGEQHAETIADTLRAIAAEMRVEASPDYVSEATRSWILSKAADLSERADFIAPPTRTPVEPTG